MSLLAALFGPSQSMADPSGWWFRGLGTQTHAGTTITEHTAFELPVVYSAIGIIADGVSQLPIDIGRKTGDVREPIEDHPLQAALNLRPNPGMSAFTVRDLLLTHALGWGNGYAEIQRDGRGEVIGLWPLLPDRTWPEPGEGGTRIVTLIDGERITLAHDRVLHIPALGFDGIRGYSPLYMARQAIGLGKALEEFGGKFFANDAKSGGFIQYPGKLGPEGRKNLGDSVNQQGGLENAHRVKVLEEGAKYVQTTISPEDAQFLLSRQFQIEEIARLYRVPLHMLQSHSKNTAWGTGIAEMSLGFVRYTLAPWLIRTEQEMNWKLLTEEERASGLYIKHNANSLLRGDPKSRAAYYQIAIASGWMTPNEVRQLEDLNPLDDDERPPAPEFAGVLPSDSPAPESDDQVMPT